MKLFELKLRLIAPVVVVCCFVCLGLLFAAPASAQQGFEGSFPPSGWTFSGGPASLGGVANSTSGIAPTEGLQYGWISTGCVGSTPGTTCPDVAVMTTPSYDTLGLGTDASANLGPPTKETVLTSPSFILASTMEISFDVNFITTDGTTTFADFALVQLIPSTGSPIDLFVANTTCDACAAVPPVDLNAGVGTRSPSTAFFSGTAVTFGATTYGNVPKYPGTGGPGGPTGWIRVRYVAPAGTYTLQFLVSHVTDTGYPSALAIDNVMTSQVQTTPVVTDGTTPTTVVFNNNTGQVVRHDVIFAATADMTFPLGPSSSLQMQSTNRLISNSTGWPPYVIGTPFAISHLFVHAGDNAVAGGTDIGSKYEDECFDTNNPPAPNQCPYPDVPAIHIRAKDIFDFPTDNSSIPIKPPIPFGTTASFIHYYQNTIPALSVWSSSSTSPNPVCTSVTNTPAFACDLEDILVNIYGDPLYGSDTKRGSYASVYNVPMLLSAVKVNGTSVNAPGIQGSSPFFVHSPLTFDFNVTPAQCPTGLGTCANNWVAAPVSNLFYTFNPLIGAPDYPGTTDLTDLTNCPGTNCNVASGTPGASSTLPVKFTTTQVMQAEGQYLLQWSAADTAKIRERNVQLLTAAGPPCPNPFMDTPAPVAPCYSTKLFSAQIVVDNTPPTITITTPANNAVYVLNQIVKASYGCTDAVSGVAPGSPTGTVPSGSNIPTSSVGVQTFTVTCTDVAGNVATTSVTYTVVSYNAFVQQPINPDGSSVFNASRGVIPVKFTLTLNGGATCALPAATIALTRTAGGTIGAIDESSYEMAADTGSNFRISGCQYIYNLAAKSLGPGTYRVDILINGVVVGSGVFALK